MWCSGQIDPFYIFTHIFTCFNILHIFMRRIKVFNLKFYGRSFVRKICEEKKRLFGMHASVPPHIYVPHMMFGSYI